MYHPHTETKFLLMGNGRLNKLSVLSVWSSQSSDLLLSHIPFFIISQSLNCVIVVVFSGAYKSLYSIGWGRLHLRFLVNRRGEWQGKVAVVIGVPLQLLFIAFLYFSSCPSSISLPSSSHITPLHCPHHSFTVLTVTPPSRLPSHSLWTSECVLFADPGLTHLGPDCTAPVTEWRLEG